MAVLLGAVFSSFNSLLNSAATLFVLDIYQPFKNTKISDKRLAYVHKSLMASILIYATITMVGAHTYMLKEKPRMYVATTVDDSLRLSNFTLATAAYCDVADTDFAGDTFVV